MIMSSQAQKPTEQKLKPKLFSVMKNYSKAQFFKDVTAGIIVAIIALPLSIALALASGVGPEQGLYTAIVAGFIVSFLGGSRVQIAGPTAAFATIVAGIVARGGEVDKLTPVGVVAAVALALQTDEEQSVGILVQLADAVVEQEGIVAFFRMLEHIERVAVVSAETVARGQPDIALRVLHHINNVVAGQSVFGAQIAVFQFCLAPRADRY